MAPALLSSLWLVLTAAVVGLQLSSGLAVPPQVAKVAPFFVAGLLTALFVDVTRTSRKLISAAILLLVSTLGWTAWSFATTDLTTERALLLAFAALPVMLVAALWALFGMMVGTRMRSRPVSTGGSASEVADTERELNDDIADIERELNDDIARELIRQRRGRPYVHPLLVMIDEDQMKNVATHGNSRTLMLRNPQTDEEVTRQVTDVIPTPDAAECLGKLPGQPANTELVARVLSTPDCATPWVTLTTGERVHWIPYWMTEEVPELDVFFDTHRESLGSTGVPHLLLVLSPEPQTELSAERTN